MINFLMMRVATRELIAAEDSAVWQYAADSTPAAIEPEMPESGLAKVRSGTHKPLLLTSATVPDDGRGAYTTSN